MPFDEPSSKRIERGHRLSQVLLGSQPEDLQVVFVLQPELPCLPFHVRVAVPTVEVVVTASAETNSDFTLFLPMMVV